MKRPLPLIHARRDPKARPDHAAYYVGATIAIVLVAITCVILLFKLAQRTPP